MRRALTLTFLTLAIVEAALCAAERPQHAYNDSWLQQEAERQEKHLDFTDGNVKSDEEKIALIMIRLEGDEMWGKGAIAAILFFNAIGLIRLHTSSSSSHGERKDHDLE